MSKQKGNAAIVVIFSVLATLAVVTIIYLFLQNQKLSQLAVSTPTQFISPTSLPVQPSTQKVPPTLAAEAKPVVVFEAEGSFSPSDKNSIQKKIIDPFIDFYTPLQKIVSITISPNTNASKDMYPFLFSAIYASGGNTGFVISKTNGEVNWFIPECMNGCQFTDAFKSKYPEIVSLSN